MKLDFIKGAGGVLVPADDHTAEKMTKIKNESVIPLDIKLNRNYEYHKKMFAFFRFSFEYWAGPDIQFQDEKAQFDHFRNELTKMAGYVDQVFNITGTEFEVRAKSLSYESMDQQEFESCSNAMMQVALTNIFVDCDEVTLNQLYSFFSG